MTRASSRSHVRLADTMIAAGIAASEDLANRLVSAGLGDVRSSDWPILRIVEHRSVPIRALIGPLAISQQAVGKAVTSLEQRGYLRRVVKPADRRVHLLELTAQGQLVLDVAERWSTDREREARALWGTTDVDRAGEILKHFASRPSPHAARGRNLRAQFNG